MVKCELPPTRTLRADAHTTHWKRFLGDYDHRHPLVDGRPTAECSSRRRLNELKQLAKVARCYRRNAERRDPPAQVRLALPPLGGQRVSPDRRQALQLTPRAQQSKFLYSSSHGQAGWARSCSTTVAHLPAMYWSNVAHYCYLGEQYRAGRTNFAMETSR